MPGLTVTEKEHWKDRLAKRIERKIEVLKASDPGLFTRLNREARVQTLQSLGLAELSQRCAVAGLPTEPRPPTEGLLRLWRPAVGWAARSGDRAS